MSVKQSNTIFMMALIASALLVWTWIGFANYKANKLSGCIKYCLSDSTLSRGIAPTQCVCPDGK
jgi:hypothetical protein